MGFEASLHQNLIFRSPQLPHTNCVFMHSELDPEEKSSKEFPVEGSERYCDEYMHCNFMEIRFHMEKAFATGRTVLIVDTSEDEKVCTYLSYQTDHSILEAKAMIQKYSSHSLLMALEYGRKLLVNAMKFGKTLVLRLGTSAPDFKDTLHDKKLHELSAIEHVAKKEKLLCTSADTDAAQPSPAQRHYFPAELFVKGGRLLRDPDRSSAGGELESSDCVGCGDRSKTCLGGSSSGSKDEPSSFIDSAPRPRTLTWAEKLFREEDSFPHKNIAFCRDEFRVCLVTQLAEGDIDEYLFGDEWGGLPSKELFQVLIVDCGGSDDDGEGDSDC